MDKVEVNKQYVGESFDDYLKANFTPAEIAKIEQEAEKAITRIIYNKFKR